MGTHLLALIDLVLCSTNDPCGNAMERVARAVCFHWGRLVPWSWTTWADYRLANAEVVTIMASELSRPELSLILIRKV